MNVLILGNGFDLDVNYKTRYSDFAKNVRLCWPFEDAKDGLGGYLQERAKTDTFYALMREYTSDFLRLSKLYGITEN